MVIKESKCPVQPSAIIYTISGKRYCADKRGRLCAISPVTQVKQCSYTDVYTLGSDQQTAIQQAKAATKDQK